MNILYKRIALNILTSWGGTITMGVVGFWMVPFLISEIGKERFDIVGICLAMIGIAQLADLGFSTALGRGLSELKADGKPRKYNELVTASLVGFGCLGILVAGILFLLSPFLSNHFAAEMNQKGEIEAVMRLQCCGVMLLAFSSAVWNGVLSSYHRFDITNNLTTVSVLLAALLQWLILPLYTDKLFIWAVTIVISQVFLILALMIAVKRVHGSLGIIGGMIRLKRLTSLLGLSMSVFCLRLAAIVSERADPFILGLYAKGGGVTFYTSAAKVSAMLRPFVTQLSGQLFPMATEVFVQKRKKDLQNILCVGTRYTMLIGGLASLGMLVFAECFSKLWLESVIGEDYLIVAWLIRGFAIVDFFTFAAGGTQWPVLFGINRLKFLVWTMLPTALLNVLISVWLVSSTSLGVRGVIVATIIIAIIRRPIMIWHTSKLCGLRISEYFIQSYLKPLIVFFLLGAVALTVSSVYQPTTWFGLVLGAAILSLVWIALSFFIAVEKEEKTKIYKLFGRLKSAIS